MSFIIQFKPDALKFIKKQSKNEQIRIINSIKNLPSSGDIKKMIGLKKENLYRLRVR